MEVPLRSFHKPIEQTTFYDFITHLAEATFFPARNNAFLLHDIAFRIRTG